MGKTFKGSQVNSQFDRKRRKPTQKELRAIADISQLPSSWKNELKPIVIQ